MFKKKKKIHRYCGRKDGDKDPLHIKIANRAYALKSLEVCNNVLNT